MEVVVRANASELQLFVGETKEELTPEASHVRVEDLRVDSIGVHAGHERRLAEFKSSAERSDDSLGLRMQDLNPWVLGRGAVKNRFAGIDRAIVDDHALPILFGLPTETFKAQAEGRGRIPNRHKDRDSRRVCDLPRLTG